MELTVLLAGLGIMVFAGMVQGLTGFGLSLMSVPFLSILASPKLVVPVVMVHGIIATCYVLYDARRSVQPRHIWPLVAAGLAGIPAGTILITVLDEDALRFLIGAVVTTFALLLFTGFSYRVARERLAFLPVGIVSGALNGSISMAGPPVILFFTNQRIPRKVFRANIVAYFAVINVAALVGFSVSGLVDGTTFRDAGALLPSLVAGLAAGNWLSPKVPEKVFRMIGLTVVSGAGVVSILTAVGLI